MTYKPSLESQQITACFMTYGLIDSHTLQDIFEPRCHMAERGVTMRTVADLKRALAVPGVCLEMLEYSIRGMPTDGALLGQVREVLRCTTTGVQIQSGDAISHLEWPGRDELEWHDDLHFTITFCGVYRMKYRIYPEGV